MQAMMREKTINSNFALLATCVLAVFAGSLEGANKNSDFRSLYDYYFPKNGQDGQNNYRRYFDDTLFGLRTPSGAKQDQQLYYALRGDERAGRDFLHSRDRSAMGAPGEEWSAECLLLLLRIGDQRFSELLRHENKKTKEAVAMAVEPAIALKPDVFPKTRALYLYRYTPPTRRQLSERSQISTVADQIILTSNEFGRLNAALQGDNPFFRRADLSC